MDTDNDSLLLLRLMAGHSRGPHDPTPKKKNLPTKHLSPDKYEEYRWGRCNFVRVDAAPSIALAMAVAVATAVAMAVAMAVAVAMAWQW